MNEEISCRKLYKDNFSNYKITICVYMVCNLPDTSKNDNSGTCRKIKNIPLFLEFEDNKKKQKKLIYLLFRNN